MGDELGIVLRGTVSHSTAPVMAAEDQSRKTQVRGQSGDGVGVGFESVGGEVRDGVRRARERVAHAVEG